MKCFFVDGRYIFLFPFERGLGARKKEPPDALIPQGKGRKQKLWETLFIPSPFQGEGKRSIDIVTVR
ncbi:hypothetical protein LH23_04035 [Cedecea neteri]|uniref:Uncharacterized protein n=1 Tax=Cedecea neteri TaxID=158822 RepID=A0AAN0S2H8_9ENTR|nr:hypothetical protein LH23_04035 [Cedecea neteri]